MLSKSCTGIAGARAGAAVAGMASCPARATQLRQASLLAAIAKQRASAIAAPARILSLCSRTVLTVRWKTSDARPSKTKAKAADQEPKAIGKLEELRMLIGFTCKVCNHRQYKTMSKNAYERGVVLMQCDGCKSRHLIADNKGWFRDKSINIEELMRERGEEVRQLTDMGLLDNIEAGGAQKAIEDYSDIVSKRNRDPQ